MEFEIPSLRHRLLRQLILSVFPVQMSVTSHDMTNEYICKNDSANGCKKIQCRNISL